MIYNVKDLVVGDKITVGVGIPLQLAWSILGWFAVSISGVTSGREINFFFLIATWPLNSSRWYN